jgi:radical SAM protein with 4Fe4S-binding SPASM domain
MGNWEHPLTNAVIEITNACNLRCNHCGSDSGKVRPQEMTTPQIISLVNDLASLGCEEITLLGGEIFLKEGWEEIARAITSHKMRLILISNGLLIDEDIYQTLREIGTYLIGISIDGSDRQKYLSLRGVDGFDRVMTLLEKLSTDSHFPHVNAITTFTKENLLWFDDFVELFSQTSITWQVQIANKGGSRFDEELFFSREDYRRFTDKATKALMENETLKLRFMDDFGYFPIKPELAFLHQTWKGCIAGRELVGIRSDGMVCGCLSLGEKFMEADLKKESLATIWKSNKYFSAFRQRSKNLSGACNDCTFNDQCLGGCAAMAISTTGKLSENSYCIRQIEEEEIVREIWE